MASKHVEEYYMVVQSRLIDAANEALCCLKRMKEDWETLHDVGMFSDLVVPHPEDAGYTLVLTQAISGTEQFALHLLEHLGGG